MKTRVQKWDASVRSRKPVVAPVPDPQLMLEQLVELITPENRHDEVETGEPVGNEVYVPD